MPCKQLKHINYLSTPCFRDHVVATAGLAFSNLGNSGHFEMRGNVLTRPRIWGNNMSKVQ
jgi:hypothetical protein